jgi:peptide/nickel transport system ATP-binding protein
MLELERVTVRFGGRRRPVVGVEGISLHVGPGERVGLVGESGSGKSTIARSIVGIVRPTDGVVRLHDRAIRSRGRDRRWLNQRVQLIFQDPYLSLDPRFTVGAALREVLVANDRAQSESVDGLLEQVRLPLVVGQAYPHELSGGQRQRVAIARALAAGPRLLIADEVTSALDVSTQASVLNLLRQLNRDHGMGLLFISHNLAVVRYMTERIYVLHRGRVVEEGRTSQVLTAPQHQYTRVLVDSVPKL